ncbi:J domain-containing protein [Streptomyces sp. NBC_01433]|uniref:J domain-containing protein n=1 Tax=Streptomyces sp. NBC_01433 TaxID=2903864 RepID=UPI002258C8BD|nr:J domain-containing protein [Streptomyces sp. NBC_01433]MCX4681371.1 J domain-containing protein [Streptomyces sp. NBC_01433]
MLAERRRSTETERLHRRRIEQYHTVFQGISARRPLPTTTARTLLHELAGAETHVPAAPKTLYRTAAAQWHPDLEDGDEVVFMLLQEAYRVVKLVSA